MKPRASKTGGVNVDPHTAKNTTKKFSQELYRSIVVLNFIHPPKFVLRLCGDLYTGRIYASSIYHFKYSRFALAIQNWNGEWRCIYNRISSHLRAQGTRRRCVVTGDDDVANDTIRSLGPDVCTVYAIMIIRTHSNELVRI